MTTSPMAPAGPGYAHWSLWSSYAFLAVDDPALLPAARRRSEEVLAQVERACSRFRDDSELSEANRRAGTWSSAGPMLVAAVRTGIRAAELTDGLVDPCLGSALVSWGYDADISEVRRRRAGTPEPPVRPRPGLWRSIEVREGAVRVPPEARLDLGATSKAWAADLVATTITQELGCTTVVSLGGDVSVHGPPGTTAEWPVQVSETRPGPGSPVVLVSGGLATSTTLLRRWSGSGGQWIHHLLDPRTGRPVEHDLRTVTALGADAVSANIASTAALVLGPSAAPWLERHGVSARLVDDTGRVTCVAGWPTDPTPEEVH